VSLIDAIKAAKQADDPNRLVDSYPYGKYLGLEAVKSEEGLVCHLPFDAKLIGNPLLPALHGGVVGALLENAALLSLMWELDLETLPKTINMSVDYLRSAKPVDSYALGLIAKPGRRVANVRVEAWQGNRAKPIAAAHGNFLLK